MGDTKGRILLTALQLFSRDGYEAVSVRNIAEALDMTKGALYRHYKNKRDIFNSIIDRMIEIDAQRAKDYQMPVEQYDELPDSYGNTSWKNIVQYTIEQLKFWTEDNFAVLFRRMLTLEQYRNAEMAELYSQCIVEGPVSYMEAMFRELMKKGILLTNSALCDTARASSISSCTACFFPNVTFEATLPENSTAF